MRIRSFISTPARVLGILLLVQLLQGCASPPGIREVSLVDALAERRISALEGQRLSHSTSGFLQRRNLLEATPDEIFVELLCEELDPLAAPVAERAHALAEMCFLEAGRQTAGSDAATRLLTTAAITAEIAVLGNTRSGPLSRWDPRYRQALELHSLSLAQLLPQLEPLCNGQDVTLPWLGGQMHLKPIDGTLPWPRAGEAKMVAADSFIPEGLSDRQRQGGIGLPLVLHQLNRDSRSDTHALRVSEFRPATLVLRPLSRPWRSGETMELSLELHDTAMTSTVHLRNAELPLETDLTAPLALMLARKKSLSGMEGLQNVEAFEELRGIYALQEHRPGAIPVVLVHGLISQPRTWLKLTAALLADTELRQRIELWYYLYPTGNPVTESAAHLRESLRRAYGSLGGGTADPALDQMVLIGHSMGGVISRMQLQSSGEDSWKRFSDVPLAELPPEDQEIARRLVFYEPLDFVRRATFICAPHRGAPLADTGLASFGASLVHLSTQFKDRMSSVLQDAGKGDQAMVTGISSLSTKNEVLVAAADDPIAPHVRYHTILGNKEEAGVPGTDGLVPYDSGHLEGAESELIIKSGHGAHTQPAAIAEVRRILSEHLADCGLRAPASVGR